MRPVAALLALFALSPVHAADAPSAAAPPAAAPPAAIPPQASALAATPAATGETAAPVPPPPPPRCTLNLHAAFDMAMDDTGRITVPVSINGTAKDIMVDTGTPNSMVTAQIANEMKLKLGFAGGGRYIVGYGGDLSFFVAHIDEFGIGNMKIKDINLFVELDWLESAGLLGADILKQFDLELDFARAKLNLMRQQNCAPGEVVYWSHQSYGLVPFELDEDHIKVKVTLDGQPITAILDTGAADTVMSLDKASDTFKLDEDKLKKSRHYPFKTLIFGEVSVGNPAIELATDRESGLMGHDDDDLHMIIGMGVLRRLHLYIDYKNHVIYVTPATQY